MAKRYCGNVSIDLKFNDRGRGVYDCRVSSPKGTHKIVVGQPAVLTVAVDSPEAYDSAARSALSFAINIDSNIADEAAFGLDDGNYVITRKKEKTK